MKFSSLGHGRHKLFHRYILVRRWLIKRLVSNIKKQCLFACILWKCNVNIWYINVMFFFEKNKCCFCCYKMFAYCPAFNGEKNVLWFHPFSEKLEYGFLKHALFVYLLISMIYVHSTGILIFVYYRPSSYY